jgi:hypothetical protein
VVGALNCACSLVGARHCLHAGLTGAGALPRPPPGQHRDVLVLHALPGASQEPAARHGTQLLPLLLLPGQSLLPCHTGIHCGMPPRLLLLLLLLHCCCCRPGNTVTAARRLHPAWSQLAGARGRCCGGAQQTVPRPWTRVFPVHPPAATASARRVGRALPVPARGPHCGGPARGKLFGWRDWEWRDQFQRGWDPGPGWRVDQGWEM